MKIIAIDPGVRCGLAVWGDEPSFFSAWSAERWDALDLFYDTSDTDVVVCERFTITPRTAKLNQAGALATIEVIGCVRYLCWQYSTRFVLQKPAEALSLVTNDVLKNLGWYTAGDDHARDATRHLGLYLVNQRLIDRRRLLDTVDDEA